MTNKIIVAICEGPHDVAFLNKSFKTIGFKSDEKSKFEDYPYPINSLIINEVKKSDIETLNIQTARQALLPSNVLVKGNTHLFLYSVGGDTKANTRKDFIKNLNSFIIKPGEIRKGRLDLNVKLGLVYFFDSDNKGIQNRLNEIKIEINEVVNDLPNNALLKNGSITVKDNIFYGAYIFSNNGSDFGKLEDIILPMMRIENENLFDSAEIFLNSHFDDNRLYPLLINSEGERIVEIRSVKRKDKNKFDFKKSLIGIVGQLQKSGFNNTVCIGQTDFLTLQKICNDVKCQEIVNFINRFISYQDN